MFKRKKERKPSWWINFNNKNMSLIGAPDYFLGGYLIQASIKRGNQTISIFCNSFKDIPKVLKDSKF